MKNREYRLSDAIAFEKARDYIKAADIYFELGKYRKAEELYRRLEQRFPLHKDMKLKLGRLLVVQKKWHEAIVKLQEVGTVGKYTEDSMYLLAECFCNSGYIHAAKEMYADLLERNYHYKDARQKLQALEAPGLSERISAGAATMITPGGKAQGSANSPYQTMMGFAVEDRYSVVEELGRGGMGVVYKAEDLETKRMVAIKVLPLYLASDENNRLRFFREAKLVADLRHPHIVTLLDVKPKDNFIVMEYLSGGTLNDWKREQQLHALELLPFIRQILEALDCVHQHGVIHRDIKPDNILVADVSTAKLTDFGIAHVCGATITHTGTHLGTIPYMSPEQILGTQIDARSDLYSVGVLLYEFFTEKLPFTGQETSFHHVHTPPPSPKEYEPEISPEVNAIILRCLAKDPDERYQDAKSLSAALATI
ncbi:MAG: protein kinase [bacterium]|nr:protein kinase [bacterium]